MTGSSDDPEIETALERGEIARGLVKPFIGETVPRAIVEVRARARASA